MVHSVRAHPVLELNRILSREEVCVLVVIVEVVVDLRGVELSSITK